MFNGIIFNQGIVHKIIKRNKGINLFIKSNLPIKYKDIGISISCDGVCLTLISKKNKILEFYLSNETLNRTKFKKIKNNDIAMFEFPRDPFQKYVKRCIGIGGDRIEIKTGDIYINAKKMDFPPNAKYITFSEGDLDGDGKIIDIFNGQAFYDQGDLKLMNSDFLLISLSCYPKNQITIF